MVCTILDTFAAWLGCHWQCHRHDASYLNSRPVHLIVCSESLPYIKSTMEPLCGSSRADLAYGRMGKGVMSGRKWAEVAFCD